MLESMDRVQPVKAPPKTKREILSSLRDIKATADLGKPVPLLGHKVTVARRFRTGTKGQWDAVYVIARAAKRNLTADAVVLLVDDAADYLFNHALPAVSK